MKKVSNSPPIDNLLPLYLSSQFPILPIIFWQDRPNEIRDKNKDKRIKESHFFMFRRLQNNILCFFYKQHFYIHQQAEIWFEIIIISGIKRSWKTNKYSKWKICWVNSIVATKFIQNPSKAVSPPSTDTTPSIWITPWHPFL